MEASLTLIGPQRNRAKGLPVKVRKVHLKRPVKTLDREGPRIVRSCLDTQPVMRPRTVVRLAVCGNAWLRSLQHSDAPLQCGYGLFHIASLGYKHEKSKAQHVISTI